MKDALTRAGMSPSLAERPGVAPELLGKQSLRADREVRMDDQSDGKKPHGAVEKTLAECEATVEHLKDENAHLRRSAQTFGDLAERLNTKRRSGKGGRPQPPRPAHQKSLPKKG